MNDALDPTPVQLTRIEGKIDLVVFQLTDHAKRLDAHENEIRGHGSEIQRLASEAAADKVTVETTARALREAKESEEAASRQAALRSESAWSPIARTLAVLAVAASLLSAYLIATR